MIEKLLKLKGRPILLSVLGWLLFPTMYLLVGILTALDLPVDRAFLIASPLGVLGFLFWVVAFCISAAWLLKAKNVAVSLGALVLSVRNAFKSPLLPITTDYARIVIFKLKQERALRLCQYKLNQKIL